MNNLNVIAIIYQPGYINARVIEGSVVDKVFNETWLDEIYNNDFVLLSSNLNIEMLWQVSDPKITTFAAKLVHVRINKFIIRDISYCCTIPGILSVYKEFCENSALIILITRMNNDPSFLVKDFLNKSLRRRIK
jgi:hypothetical protein